MRSGSVRSWSTTVPGFGAWPGSVTEPAEDPYGNQRFAIKLATTVDRTHFDLNWNMPLPTGQPALSNDVRILGDLYFVKAA